MANNMYGAMIELQVLNYVFQTNSVAIFSRNDIVADHFTTYKPHYTFIVDYVNKYNQLPSRETFQGKFANEFEWLTITDPEEYLVEKLEEAKLYRSMVSDYKAIGELIKSEQSDKAIEKMAVLASQYQRRKKKKCVDLIDDGMLRYESYMERVNNPNKCYVTTGLKELDEITGGWDRINESAVISARTGFGKSWWLIYFALAAAKQGLRVGFYSGEMELDLVGYRMDTFNANIANGSLTHGNESIKDTYLEYIKNLNKTIPGHIYCIEPDDYEGGVVTVSRLRSFVDKMQLDMLCIDQLSLLTDERGGRTSREQTTNISKDLRTMQRLRKIPIITAVQQNREETKDNGGPSSKNLAESDQVGRDSTTIIFVERKGDNVILTLDKARNSRDKDKLTYFWQINTGVLHYIPTEKDAKHKGNMDSNESAIIYNDSGKSDSVF